MRKAQNILMFLSASTFLFFLALTIVFGSKAILVSGPVVSYVFGTTSVKDKVIILRACQYSYCKDWIAEQILLRDPHNLDALGAIAIGYVRRGEWQEAEFKFDQYFAEGGNALEVQKWYQKLLSHQARNVSSEANQNN